MLFVLWAQPTAYVWGEAVQFAWKVFSETVHFSKNPFGAASDTEMTHFPFAVVFVEQAGNAQIHYIAKNMKYYRIVCFQSLRRVLIFLALYGPCAYIKKWFTESVDEEPHKARPERHQTPLGWIGMATVRQTWQTNITARPYWYLFLNPYGQCFNT